MFNVYVRYVVRIKFNGKAKSFYNLNFYTKKHSYYYINAVFVLTL